MARTASISDRFWARFRWTPTRFCSSSATALSICGAVRVTESRRTETVVRAAWTWETLGNSALSVSGCKQRGQASPGVDPSKIPMVQRRAFCSVASREKPCSSFSKARAAAIWSRSLLCSISKRSRSSERRVNSLMLVDELSDAASGMVATWRSAATTSSQFSVSVVAVSPLSLA